VAHVIQDEAKDFSPFLSIRNQSLVCLSCHTHPHKFIMHHPFQSSAPAEAVSGLSSALSHTMKGG
jgi:hypothetical protein